jgi:hypothetical protein
VPITIDDLTVNFSGVDASVLVEDWRWLVGDQRVPILLTALGDAFLQDVSDGSVHLLAVGPGTIEQVAASFEEFKALLNDKEFVGENFVPRIVVELRGLGQTLAPGQIYGYKIPPVLGGKYSTENLEPTDIRVHFSILGQTHRQLQNVPEGTSIADITIE